MKTDTAPVLTELHTIYVVMPREIVKSFILSFDTIQSKKKAYLCHLWSVYNVSFNLYHNMTRNLSKVNTD